MIQSRKLRLLATLLLMFSFAMVKAQEIKVVSFAKLSQAEDPDARDAAFRREDKQASRSGQYCAIIKVITTEQDRAFTFDLGTDYVPEYVDYRDNGEIWVYVPAGTNKMKISHKRHGQINTRDGYYNFSTNGITKCEAATVYRLRIQTDFNPDDDIIKDPNRFATVNFKVNASNAVVLLRKIPEHTDSLGALTKVMPIGKYNYSVGASGFLDYHGAFELNKESEEIAIDITLVEGQDSTGSMIAKAVQTVVSHNTVQSILPVAEKKLSLYAQPSYQLGSMQAVELALGCYLSGINIEAFGSYGLSKESIYWNKENNASQEEKFGAMCVGGRLGYRVKIGNVLRVTPQVGGRLVMISGDKDTKTNAVSALVGAKIEYKPSGPLGIFVAPEYGLALTKGEVFKRLSPVSDKIKKMAEGFNCRVGLTISF